MLWTLAAIFAVLIAGISLFLVWNSSSSRQSGSLTLSDFINLLTAFLTLVGLAVAFDSLQIANQAYQKSVQDGLEQQKNLDASRVQLQAVVEAAIKQQSILNQNLETSKAQQELLNKNLQTSKIQQEIQSKNLETSKAQLTLLEEQNKREQERLARKPIAEIGIQTHRGSTSIMESEKLPALEFELEKDKKWSRMVFLVSNKGNIEVSRPTVRISAFPQTVSIDHADYRMSKRHEHHILEFSGPGVKDIDPLEISPLPYSYTVDITVPDTIEAFDLTVSVQGGNLTRIERKIHLKVTRQSS